MDAVLRKGRKRMRTVAFRVDEEAFARIDVLSGLSGLSKQDYMEARMLDESVVVFPSSRVVKKLLEYAQEIYEELLCARREARGQSVRRKFRMVFAHLVGILNRLLRWCNARHGRGNRIMGALEVTS